MKRTMILALAIGLTFLAQEAQADWTTAKRLTWNSGSSVSPDLAVDSSGAIHLVWCDTAPGNLEIYYKKSSDGGNTWLPNQRLSWNSGESGSPAIAADSSGNLNVVWHDRTPLDPEIYYKKSTDGGTTWLPSKRFTWTPGLSQNPDIAVDTSGKVHVVWFDQPTGDVEIYYRRSADGGATWTASRRLTYTSGWSVFPVIAVDPSGHLHMVWQDDTPGNREIYHKKSTDGGVTWTAGKRLSWTPGSSEEHCLAIGPSGHLYLAWRDLANGYPQIYFSKSTDGGASWTTSQRLTWTSYWSGYPSLAADSAGNIHLVWQYTTALYDEIFYKKSTDGGATWTPGQRMTWNPGSGLYPRIAVDPDDKLQVVWEDNTPGDYEIYYKRGQ